MQDYHTYRCTVAVAGCTKFIVSERYPILVDEPPDETYTVPTGNCAGTTFVLDEPEDE